MTTLNHLAPLAAASLVSAIWQSALLALCVAILLRLLTGITAAARSLIWTAVFLLTLALPFAHQPPASSNATVAPSSLHVAPVWVVVIAAVWAALSLLRAARLAQSAIRLYGISSRSTLIAPTTQIAFILNRASVRLCASADVDVPSVAGFFHPCILLPTTLLESISPADLHHIVLHELEHLRRRDDWTNLLQKLALVLFPVNPVLLWVERRLCLERELACDDHVLQATNGASKAYATCLTNLAEASLLHRGLSLALGAWHRQSELTRRVHRILRNPAREMRPTHTAALTILILAATFGTGLLAAKSPQFITFTSAPTAEAATTPAPMVTAFHPTFVKATLPQPRPVLTNLTLPRKHPRRSTRLAAQRRKATSNVILIGWQQPDAPARWTVVPHTFRLTYAAVPTRTVWLVFQL